MLYPRKRQLTLDSSIEVQPRMPPFTTQGLLDYVIELVVLEDKALQLIDKGSFRRLLTYLRPTLSERDVPHRNKLHKEILLRAETAEARVKAALQV
jgi:hypothetical protein